MLLVYKQCPRAIKSLMDRAFSEQETPVNIKQESRQDEKQDAIMVDFGYVTLLMAIHSLSIFAFFLGYISLSTLCISQTNNWIQGSNWTTPSTGDKISEGIHERLFMVIVLVFIFKNYDFHLKNALWWDFITQKEILTHPLVQLYVAKKCQKLRPMIYGWIVWQVSRDFVHLSHCSCAIKWRMFFLN